MKKEKNVKKNVDVKVNNTGIKTVEQVKGQKQTTKTTPKKVEVAKVSATVVLRMPEKEVNFFKKIGLWFKKQYSKVTKWFNS